jgi:NADH:ubiquinone oxidoreductase subunit F (NADH-binding)
MTTAATSMTQDGLGAVPPRPRVLLPAGAEHHLGAHLARFGPLPDRSPVDLLAELSASGLTGRGGAGFPAVRKWHAVARARGRAVIVANGAEGEPASAKDRVLLANNPHLVLDGLQLAARAVGARRAVLVLGPAAFADGVAHRAVQQRVGDPVPVEVVAGGTSFLSGEESALVDALESGPGLPRNKLPRVSERGVNRRPTLVQNVETLAHVALLARGGATWWRSTGTEAEPGTLLVSVHDVDGNLSVTEVAHGTALARLLRLDDAGAVLVGGYHGTWVSAEVAQDLSLSRRSLSRVGASPGAGVVAALPRRACGVAQTARVVSYLAAQSAGQCGPCLNALPRIAVCLELLAAGQAHSGHLDAVHRWAGLVVGRGACHHPDGSVRLVRSALTTFADEVETHLDGRCSATDRRPLLPVPAGGS